MRVMTFSNCNHSTKFLACRNSNSFCIALLLFFILYKLWVYLLSVSMIVVIKNILKIEKEH